MFDPVSFHPLVSSNFDIFKAYRVDNESDSVTYFGFALIGTEDDDELWNICKVTVSGNITKWEWANGRKDFLLCWNNRKDGSYTYI